MSTKALAIDTKPQFFLDDLFFAEQEGISLQVNPPRKAGVVMEPVHPWEAYRIAPSAVLEDEGVYKMWYLGIARYEGVPGQVACPRCAAANEGVRVVCRHCGWPLRDCDWVHRELYHQGYAISTDGVHWERPRLGLLEYGGDWQNNFFPFTGAMCVPAVNPKAPPAERFMAFSEQGGRQYLSVSPDGVHWTLKPSPVLPFCADTNNQIFYDPASRKYLALLRGFPGRRTVVWCETENLDRTPWPFTDRGRQPDKTGTVYITDEMEVALDRDAEDPSLDLDINHLSATPYADGVWFGVPGLFRHYPGDVDGKGRESHRYFAQGNDGTFETQLAVSRDGRVWRRPDRRPYVENDLYGEPDGGLIFVCGGMIRHGDEVYQYYMGQSRTHGIFEPHDPAGVGQVFRLVQRRDRFIAVAAGPRGGRFLTPLLRLPPGARTLVLNIDCQGLGEAFVQVRDAEGRPLPGFTRADCDPIDLNHLRHIVAWRGQGDLVSLAGQPVRLEFFLRSTKLYTFSLSRM